MDGQGATGAQAETVAQVETVGRDATVATAVRRGNGHLANAMTGIRADRTPTVRVIAASVPARRRQPATPTALRKEHTSGNGHAVKAAREGRSARAPAARPPMIRRLPPTVGRSD
jgi:hypothetical protein